MPPSELAAALAKVQKELKPIARTQEGQAGTRKVKYADLSAVTAAVYPLLAKNGLAFIAKPTLRDDGKFVLAYSLLHESGEREDGEYPMHGSAKAQDNGSEVTYARRYSLCAITGAVPEGEDDDGAAASKGSGGRPRQVQRPSAQVTRTRTTGADHERLRDGTVEPAPGDRPAQRTRKPDDDSPWQDQPAGKANGLAGTVGAIQQHFKRLEVLDREERLGLTAQLAGWKRGEVIGSTNDLSADEAKRVLDQLAKCRNHETLMNLVTHGERPGGTSE